MIWYIVVGYSMMWYSILYTYLLPGTWGGEGENSLEKSCTKLAEFHGNPSGLCQGHRMTARTKELSADP